MSYRPSPLFASEGGAAESASVARMHPDSRDEQRLSNLRLLRRVRDRIDRAMTLLRRGDLSVTEVCLAVGYGSLGTFTTRFTELVGVSPGKYRREGNPPLNGLPGIITMRATKPVRNREVSQGPSD